MQKKPSKPRPAALRQPKIVDVKIAFAFSHPSATKRFTWKAGRGATLQAALGELAVNRYNYWNDGEKDLISQEFLSAMAVIKNSMLFPSGIGSLGK